MVLFGKRNFLDKIRCLCQVTISSICNNSVSNVSVPLGYQKHNYHMTLKDCMYHLTIESTCALNYIKNTATTSVSTRMKYLTLNSRHTTRLSKVHVLYKYQICMYDLTIRSTGTTWLWKIVCLSKVVVPFHCQKYRLTIRNYRLHVPLD